MEICKHIKTGKYFVYIEDIRLDKMLLITPEAQVKTFRSDLFDEVEDCDEDQITVKSLITVDQIKEFNKFKKDRSADFIEDIILDIEDLTPQQQQKVIHQLKERHMRTKETKI